MERYRTPQPNNYLDRYDQVETPVIEAFIHAHEDLLGREDLAPEHRQEAQLSLIALREQLKSRREDA